MPSFVLAEFEWKDTEGKYFDLKSKSRSIARYVYEPIDDSSAERREETYKPFCHIYRPSSKDSFLTKGPGGKFTHHRGIFYGFSKCSYTDESGELHENIDTWHCRKAHQIHRKFLKQEAGEDSASFTAAIDWIDNEGKVFAKEERTMTFSLDENDIVVDFESTLAPTVPSVRLDGDPQHAGFQFRANNDVNENTKNATYYLRPAGKGEPGQTINWSSKLDNDRTKNQDWKAMCFTLDEKQYTVVYLDHPENPKPSRYSERDYGRFGSYFVADVPKDDPLTVNYRLVIHSGEMEVEEAAALHEAFVAE